MRRVNGKDTLFPDESMNSLRLSNEMNKWITAI